ncbi:hypothetical protein G6F64_014532 [Rhizopus arrhizus]|uniref:IclR-ED domain-containing protein n=1 Tax=Rhizopus oryzae TaxID=64495 RepID=A0A9P6WTA0_RHIOR|nr:hypothetical protein G6F64_014532 [Rhizopus arrhizus]
MALLAALPADMARGSVERNSGRLDEYGGMTPQEMYRLIEMTRARGYWVGGYLGVRGALGVGCALLDSQGAPLLAVSVTAIIDRMPAQRQRESAGWIKAELARLAMQA